MSRKIKNKKKPIVIIILFLIGLFITIYPLVSRVYYDYQGSEEVQNYEEELARITTAERNERLQLAYAYNNALLSGDNSPIGDPFSEEEKEQGVLEYAKSLKIREKIGKLTIPKINLSFPVYAGTGESILQKGVGHLEGTSLPIGGLTSHSFLTAHRGLPENKLFTDLDKLELKDLFFVKTIAGELAYEVIEIKVIEPTQTNEIQIEKNKDLVTLLTCTPYMINSHRLLVTGERVELPQKIQKEATTIRWWDHFFSLISEYIWLCVIVLLAAIILTIKYILTIRQKKG